MRSRIAGSAWSRSQLGVSMMWASASCTTYPVRLYGTANPPSAAAVVAGQASHAGDGASGRRGGRPGGGAGWAPAAGRGTLALPQQALVAQLERASDYGSEGWGFESRSEEH